MMATFSRNPSTGSWREVRRWIGEEKDTVLMKGAGGCGVYGSFNITVLPIDIEHVPSTFAGNSQVKKVDTLVSHLKRKLYGDVDGIKDIEEGLEVYTRTVP